MGKMVVCNFLVNMWRVISFALPLSDCQGFFAWANLFLSNHTEGIADTDLVLLVTTRPTTGNTLAWAVACERDQWGRAIAGIFPSSVSSLLQIFLLKPIVIFFFQGMSMLLPAI